MNNMILIISYDYYPLVTPNSFRWSSVAELLVKKNYRVFVIAAWKPQLPREELLNGVQVYRVGGQFIETVRTCLQPQIKTPVESKAGTPPIKSHSSRDLLRIVHDLTWKNIYWPDYACTWYFPALKKAKQLLDKFNIQNCITVSIPFTSHLVGKSIQKFRPDINWIVDISDPFSFLKSMPTNNHLLYSSLNKFAERKVFSSANVISLLTKTQKNKYSELYPKCSDKIHVNPNILIDIHKNIDLNSIYSQDAKIRLIFIGMLKRGVRTPDGLLKVFSLLLKSELADNIELHFYGGIDYCKESFAAYDHLINKSIFMHGVVSRELAIKAMFSADFLVNIGNSNPYQEPSKVIEYASTGKPIINISTIKNDSSYRLLQHYPALCNIDETSTEDISATIEHLVQFILSPPTVDICSLNSWLKPYTIESIVDNYESMLSYH